MVATTMAPAQVIAEFEAAKATRLAGPEDARALVNELRRLWKAADSICDVELMDAIHDFVRQLRGSVNLAIDHMAKTPANLPAFRVAWQWARAYRDDATTERIERIVASIDGPETPPPAPKPTRGGRRLENGTYTVVSRTNQGDYFTLRIEDDFRQDGPAGAQVISYLAGPDNERDFQGCAFLEGWNVKMWRKFHRSELGEKVRRAMGALESRGQEGRLAAMEQYALKSGRCAKCGRTLTVPASIHRGVGPECAKQLGLA